MVSTRQKWIFFCLPKYFVLLYIWQLGAHYLPKVPNFDGPSATRRECHILLKRTSLTKLADTEEKFLNLRRSSLCYYHWSYSRIIFVTLGGGMRESELIHPLFIVCHLSLISCHPTCKSHLGRYCVMDCANVSCQEGTCR